MRSKKRRNDEDEYGRRTRVRTASPSNSPSRPGHKPSRSDSSSPESKHRRRRSRSRSPVSNRDRTAKAQRTAGISHGGTAYSTGGFNRGAHSYPPFKGAGTTGYNRRRRRNLMTYKEFMTTLPDDVSPDEALEAYMRYKTEFSKSEERMFWEAHRKEEWFQERYDPVVIEQLRQAKAKRVTKATEQFMQDVKAAVIPELNYNCLGVKLRPSLSPKLTTEENQDVRESKASTMSKDSVVESNASVSSASSSSSSTSSSSSSSNVSPASKIPNEEKSKSIISTVKDMASSAPASKTNRLEFDGPRTKNLKPASSSTEVANHAEKVHRAPSKLSDDVYNVSVFIQAVPLEVKRASLVSIFEKRQGFRRLVLCDPGRNGQKLRYGWAEFTSRENCAAVLKESVNGGLNGTSLGTFFLNLWPKARWKLREPICPNFSLTPPRVEHDLLKALELVKKMDKEFNINVNTVFERLLENQHTNLLKLNLVLGYLQRIHYTSYYQGEVALTEEKLMAKCGPSFKRESVLNTQEARENYKPTEEDYRWAEDVDTKVDQLIKAKPPETLKAWLDKQKQKIFKDNTIKVAEHKFRCALCRKLFRAPGYVHKHLVNKHSPIVKKYIQAERDKHYFENYSRDPEKITQADLDSVPVFGTELDQNADDGRRGQSFRERRAEPTPEKVRPIPVHYTAPPPRTFASYKDVVLEEELDAVVVAPEESDEEIDYGFGDYISPPKFNL